MNDFDLKAPDSLYKRTITQLYGLVLTKEARINALNELWIRLANVKMENLRLFLKNEHTRTEPVIMPNLFVVYKSDYLKDIDNSLEEYIEMHAEYMSLLKEQQVIKHEIQKNEQALVKTLEHDLIPRSHDPSMLPVPKPQAVKDIQDLLTQKAQEIAHIHVKAANSDINANTVPQPKPESFFDHLHQSLRQEPRLKYGSSDIAKQQFIEHLLFGNTARNQFLNNHYCLYHQHAVNHMKLMNLQVKMERHIEDHDELINMANKSLLPNPPSPY